jgi:glycosyltransferase involved in cell wall biosynthesis
VRICFFADGESIHTIRWCKHFHSLGHEVHLISFKKADIEFVYVHHIKTDKIEVSGGNWRVLLKFRQVKSIINKIKPDIFHAHYATSYGVTGALVGFHPYIITALGSDVLISPSQSLIYRLLLKFAFSKADWITAMSDQMTAAISQLGVSSQKISTVPFGIDPGIFNNNKRALPVNDFVITSTRNFEEIYNIPHLLRAVALVKDQIPQVRLNLIGDGTQREVLKKQVKELGLESITNFFGRIPQHEIASVLNRSHLFITVSLSDGNNISLNEAMACGALPIATDIPANKQWIEHHKNGFLIPINDIDGLAKTIMHCYRNFNSIIENVVSLNQNIIQEKAIWSKHMDIVAKKYNQLINS